MNESRSLIRNSARSSDRLWLACRISTRNNQHMVERRTAAAGAVGPRHSPLQIRPEKLKIHQTIQPLERVALRRKLLQTLLHIKEPGLTPHPTPRSRSAPRNHDPEERARRFLEVSDRMDRGEPLHRRVAHCPRNCRTALTKAGP